MKLAFIVLAHQRPAQLALLLSSLQHPAARTYLHIDRRARIAPFESEFARHGIAEVELLPRHDSPWGGIGAVDAALEGLSRGLRERCDYFVLLSGQDFPRAANRRDRCSFFAERRERSYLGYFSLPDWHWAYDGRIRTDFYTYDLSSAGRETVFPRGEEPALEPEGESTERAAPALDGPEAPTPLSPVSCARSAAQRGGTSARTAARIRAPLCSMHHPDYRTYHRYTLAADEIFFHSILLGTSFGETHPTRQRSASLHYSGRLTASHPKTLRSDDLPAMLESGKPFGRKFDLRLDRSVIENLPA